MELTRKTVDKRLTEYSEIGALIKRAFPKGEQNPMWLLRYWEKRKGAEFYAYYDGDRLCGFSYTIREGNVVFAMYLAVSDRIRSRGYGSAILRLMKEYHRDREIVLNIEPPDKTAENNEQRVKRLTFYKQNGFYNSGTQIRIGKSAFLVLSTKQVPDLAAYSAILRRLSFGLHRAKFVQLPREDPGKMSVSSETEIS